MIKVTIGTNLGRTSIIVDENSTLRQTLEENNIDYTIGMTSLDGSTLRPGDLDKTFADFGIVEKCYLLQTVKADNAAKVKVFGNACVIESDYSVDDLQKVAKFRPKKLSLFTDDKEEYFKVMVGKGLGGINKYGASFSATPSANKKAVITMTIPEGTEDPKKWAEDAIGVSILNLNKVESGLGDVLMDIYAEQCQVASCIEVL